MARAVSYSSAPCGAGKTFQLCEKSREITKAGGNVLLIQPTKVLADRTAEDEFKQRPNCPLVRVFHGGTVGRSVGHQLAEYLADPEDGPQVVIATHQVLPLITHLPKESKWHLMIDECPQIDRSATHQVMQTHDFITRHIQIEPFNDIYGRIVVANREAIKRLARNQDDDELWDQLQETARILLNPHWDSFVDEKQYNRLIAGDSGELTIHSILRPTVIDGFASVFMAGANFEDSAVYNLWGRGGIKWNEDRRFTSKLRYDAHPNGQLATIYYGIENNWSATKRNASKTNGILENMRVATTGLFGTSNYLWQANKVVPNEFLHDGTRLPNNPLGLNTYSDSHDIAFLSALNPTPAHSRFLRDRGLTPDQIDRMGYCSTLYQSVMRTSLRDPTDLNKKRIVVVDRRAADYLHRRLPGSTVEKLDTGIIETSNKPGRRKIHADNAEKSRIRRELDKEKRRRLMLETMLLPASQDHDGVAVGNGSNLRIDIPIDYIPHFDTQLAYHGTLYSHKKSSQPESYVYCAGWNEFVQSMEVLSQWRCPAKEGNELISPAIFDPDRVVFDPSGKRLRRGRGNIVYLQNIMLDFEKGDLRPEQFAEMFPDVQMVITNTWGHTRDRPRFRVIIPTTRQMTADVYEAIFDEIVQRMADQGVVRTPGKGSNFRKSGLDHSKRSAASLFFLPCQAEIPDESFFDVYDGPGRQPLDPAVWIETARLVAKYDFEFVTIQPQQGEYDQVRLDAAISGWRHETLPKEGNPMFYLFAVELKKIGMMDYEIEAKLREESRYGRSPAKRLRQIPSIMTSLAKWKAKVPGE